MRISRTIWIALGALLVWFAFSWLLGPWIGLHAPGLYYLRGGLAILGIIGFVGFLLLKPKSDAAGKAVSAGEVDDHFSEASRRLQAGGVKQMASLPAVFFLGDSDAAKTTAIAKSDIAQLLAGQAQQDAAIVPTRAVNFWIANGTIFVDPAGAVLSDEGMRRRLFRRFSAVALKSVMGGGKMPARAVVLAVDCGTLLKEGGAEAVAGKARQYQAILSELAQETGGSFPVYVLFTKADKIPYFRDYVQHLTEREAAEAFGITLPGETQTGVYAELQTRKLTDAFQQLYYWLADRRSVYLFRENKAAALPNIYEFPREFNKLRPLLTSFLVDLCRPSQLGISPFLRGFYFTGIRPVTVNDVAPAAVQVEADEGEMDAGATRMFTVSKRGAPLAAEVRDTPTRKVAQWVFLSHLLPDVVLADGAVAGGGGGNLRLNAARRVLLGLATAAALAMGVWWTVSFLNNRELVNGALEAAKGVPAVNVAAGQAPSLDSLRRLTKVKDTLGTLNYFEEHGRPLSYGAFLYSGDETRDAVRKTYYGLFRRLLLAPTQERLAQVCSSPSDAQGQDFLYTALKAYLITTENHDKSTPEFLTPALFQHWKGNQPMEGPREDLARQNFDFYARELLKQNEFLPPTKADTTAVGNCRDYLNKFGQTSAIYRRMLNDAGAGGKPIIFNTDFPGSELTVLNSYRVDPAFSKNGFATFENALKNPDKYFHGDEWVLKPPARQGLDKSKLVPELADLYQGDFKRVWQEYLQATKVRPYGGLQDAVGKLDQLSGARSPLLAVLCVAGENTAVQKKEIAEFFQPVQYVAGQGCSQGMSEAAKPYMGQLVTLQAALKAIGPLDRAKPDDVKTAQGAANSASSTVKNMALNFKGPEDAVVAKLLQAPIYAPNVPTPSAPNDLAKNMCAAIAPMLAKYPFNPTSREDATLEDLNKFLKKPEGLLWTVVNDPAMKPYLVQLGDNFSPASGVEHPARRAFVDFLNKSAHLGHVLYSRDNGQAPGFSFTMKPVPSPIVEHIDLKINGKQLSTDGRTGSGDPFSWPGDASGTKLEVRWTGGTSFSFPERPGLWGVWHFMDLGREVAASQTEFKWVNEVGGVENVVAGKPAEVHFTLDATAAQVLRPHYFSLACTSVALGK